MCIWIPILVIFMEYDPNFWKYIFDTSIRDFSSHQKKEIYQQIIRFWIMNFKERLQYMCCHLTPLHLPFVYICAKSIFHF